MSTAAVAVVVVVVVYLFSSTMTSSSPDFRSASGDGVVTVLEYAVQEEVAAGTLVGSVAADSRLADRHPPEVLSRMRFRFLTGAAPAWLELEEGGGVLRTVGRVDREELCGGDGVEQSRRAAGDDHQGSCVVRLDVAVQPMNYFRIFKVSRSRFAIRYTTLYIYYYNGLRLCKYARSERWQMTETVTKQVSVFSLLHRLSTCHCPHFLLLSAPAAGTLP